jgi:hypothetical protein
VDGESRDGAASERQRGPDPAAAAIVHPVACVDATWEQKKRKSAKNKKRTPPPIFVKNQQTLF